MSKPPYRFALIGLGGISRTLLSLLATAPAGQLACVAVLVREGRQERVELPVGIAAVTSVGALLGHAPDLVADCAGHGALRQYGPCLLHAGAKLLSVSSGALADPALEAELRAAQAAGGERLLFVPGALAGLDGLAAARHGGLERVAYRGIKPARAWKGTPAERLLDLDRLTEPTVFFRGTAREAAAQYPANANVTATVALAGLGFERTEVELTADPAGQANRHCLTYSGAFGEAALELRGRPSPDNPKTSLLTAFSVWQALQDGGRGCIPLP